MLGHLYRLLIGRFGCEHKWIIRRGVLYRWGVCEHCGKIRKFDV